MGIIYYYIIYSVYTSPRKGYFHDTLIIKVKKNMFYHNKEIFNHQVFILNYLQECTTVTIYRISFPFLNFLYCYNYLVLSFQFSI